MKNRIVSFLIAGLFLAAAVFGVAHSAWVSHNAAEIAETGNVDVQPWDFGIDTDFAKIENVRSCDYLTATKEISIVKRGSEAVRFTNTAGTQTKAHTVIMSTDRDYTVGEIKTMKVEFEYYHAHKRQQAGRGYPKVQLMYGSTSRGTDQGGTDSVTSKSPFVAKDVGVGWWHLEYFITAMVPTMADHQDTPISQSLKVNGIKITDSAIYDYDSETAFIIIDKLRFGYGPAERLGLFNRTFSFASGGYYWVKVCWAGELHSVDMVVDDVSVAVYAPSEKSPFYIKGLKAGKVSVIITLVAGDDMTSMTISTSVTVT